MTDAAGEPRRVLGGAIFHVPHPPHKRQPPGVKSAGINPALVLITSCVILFMIAVNTTAINTALNAIADDLGMGASDLGWAVGIYMLAVAAFVVLGGSLGDLLGQRRMLLAGLLVYAGGALLVALAQDAAMAIGGRAVQGLGGAVLMPATMAVLRIAYPPERQGYALGIWGAVGGLGFALGPLIGGVLTDEVDWRWIWWGTVILSFGLAVVSLGTMRAMPQPTERPRFDPIGIVLLPVGLFSLILALQQGPIWGWESAKTIAAFAVSIASLVSLAIVESRLEHPLLHIKLLRNPALAAANVGTTINTLSLMGVLFFFNLYAQSIFTLNYTAVEASLALLPYGLCVFAASLIIGRICDRVGYRWPLALGMILMGAGLLLLSRVDPSTTYGDLWWPTMILGLGVGITFSAPSAAGLRAVPSENAGEASGIINVARYLSAALVVAVGSIAFTSVGSSDLNDHLERASLAKIEREKLDQSLTGAPAQVESVERDLDQRQLAAFRAGSPDGVTGGFSAVMLGLGVVTLLSAPIWVVLMRPTREP